MLNPQGGVVDDLIVYLRDEPQAPARYRLVVNAGTADKDLAWMRAQGEGQDLTIRARTDLGDDRGPGPPGPGQGRIGHSAGPARVAPWPWPPSLRPRAGTGSSGAPGTRGRTASS